jgi:LysR family glycine cleavage system transcriptional activator
VNAQNELFFEVAQAELNMNPSLESLRILEICVSCASFARAADRLHLTPAAISLRIRALEEELGERLFVRQGPRVIPTPAAEKLASGIRHALAEVATALEAFRAEAQVLRVTAPPSFAARWLAPRLANHPVGAVELDVSTGLRAPAAFDLAIRTGRGQWPGLKSHRLFPVRLTPLVSPASMRGLTITTPLDLTHLVLLPHPDWQRWFEKTLGVVPERLRFANVDYPSHELNVEAACAGQGVALAPPEFFTPLIEDGQLIAPFDSVLEGPDWHFALVHENDARPAPHAFRRWLCSQAQAFASDLAPSPR